MSTTDLVAADDLGAIVPSTGAAVEAHDAHAHPGPRQYVMIAVILVVITAIEVGMSYITGLNSNVLILMLLGAAAVKFFLVAAWFMHLKTDAKILRRLFLMGLIGATILFFIIFLTLHGMQNSYNIPSR